MPPMLAAQTISPRRPCNGYSTASGNFSANFRLLRQVMCTKGQALPSEPRCQLPRYRKFQSTRFGVPMPLYMSSFLSFRDDTRALDFTSLSPTSGRPFQATAATEKLEKNGNKSQDWSSWKDSAILPVEISYMSYSVPMTTVPFFTLHSKSRRGSGQRLAVPL